jgi:peptidylprolyl isomerase
MRLFAAAAVLLAAAVPASAEETPAPPQAPAPAAAAPASAEPAHVWRTLDPANTLLIETTKGRIIVDMRPELAPLTVARIKALTRQGYYNGALFYRVIQGFAAQTGDKGSKQYRSSLPNLKGEMTFALTPAMGYASVGSSPGGDAGFIGTTPVMIATAPGAPAGQAPTSGRGHIAFCPGVVAMAHPNNQPDGGNSQFFFMRGIGTTLERNFAAWGRVVVGQSVVEAIKNGEPPVDPDKMTRLRVLSDIPAAQRPKVEVSDLKGPQLEAIVRAAAAAKGPSFSLCDVPIQARVTP